MRIAAHLALLVCLLLISARSTGWAQDAVTFASVEAMAAKLAAEPYSQPPSIEGDMRRLTYDQYRALRPRPNTAPWRDGKSPFRVEFFPAGFIYEKPVQIFVVEGGKATPLAISADQFDFSDTGLKQPPQKLELAGFRLLQPLNRPGKFDEVVSFLGASYFRRSGGGRSMAFGARACHRHGLGGKPEEFPLFRAFWLLKPAANAKDMTVWALLESPGAAGAFSFTIRPGARTAIDTKCIVYMRNDVACSASRRSPRCSSPARLRPRATTTGPRSTMRTGCTFRPARASGSGARWKIPRRSPSPSFQDRNPRGFGLLQRERDFDRYQDSAAKLEARPGLWVEPAGDWGDGEVRLVEIPHPVGDQRQRRGLLGVALARAQGRPQGIRLPDLLADGRGRPVAAGRVIATRTGPVPSEPKQRRMVVEFAGGKLGALEPQQPVTADVSSTNAKVARSYVEALPWKRSWRLFIDFEPEGKKPVELRAACSFAARPLTETWTAVFRP